MKRLLSLVALLASASLARGADVDELVKQLKNGDSEDRRAAAKSLGEGGAASKAAVPDLINALKDRDMFVRRFAAEALGEIGPDAAPAVRPLTAALDDSRKEVQNAAAVALGKLGSSGMQTLIAIVGDSDKEPAIRRQAIDSLVKLGDAAHSAVPSLTEIVKGNGGKNKKKAAPEDLRVDAATALGSLAKPSDKATVETLRALTDKKAKTPRGLRQAANMALRKIQKNK
jgi:HEAT repeat protein